MGASAQTRGLRQLKPFSGSSGSMVAANSNAPSHPRRSHPRLRLGLPARLETLFGTWDVQLVDLSQTGARLDVAVRPKVRTGVLKWLGFEAMGDVVWRNDHLLGMTFDEQVSLETIVATRDADPSVIGEVELVEAARAWATGASGLECGKPKAI